MTSLKQIRRIAIIGGGPAGLATAKYLLAENVYKSIDIFEQRNTVEGTWEYALPMSSEARLVAIPQTNPVQPPEWPVRCKDASTGYKDKFLSPMYDHLETNIPHTLMKFSDWPFPAETQLFPSRQAVCKYLDDYAKDVMHLIKFAKQVTSVEREWSERMHRDIWIMKYKDVNTQLEDSASYDAVAVCSGHYTVPFVPAVEGMEAWKQVCPQVISHSKFYRSPEIYRDTKVLVVGNSASGLDIASQIKAASKQPVLISRRSESMWKVDDKTSGQKEMPQVVEFLDPSDGTRSVRFADGQIEHDVGAVLFCTGYLYSYPFLPSLHSDLITDGFRVRHVYQHMFYIGDPTLAFIALPMKVLPFPLSETQAAVLARVWSGRLSLPSRDDMLAWENKTIEEQGDGKGFHTLNPPKDMEYHNYMYDWAIHAGLGAGKFAHRWVEKEFWLRSRFPALKDAFSRRGPARYQVRTVEELGSDCDLGRYSSQEEGSSSENDSQFRTASQFPAPSRSF